MRLPSGSFAGLTKSVAPIFFAQASLPGLVSTAIMRDALTSADVAMTPRPMAPQPKTATVLLAMPRGQLCKMTPECSKTYGFRPA